MGCVRTTLGSPGLLDAVLERPKDCQRAQILGTAGHIEGSLWEDPDDQQSLGRYRGEDDRISSNFKT